MSRRSRRKRRRQQDQGGIFSNLINTWTLSGLALVLIGLIAFVIAVNRPPPATSGLAEVTNQPNIPAPEVPRIPLPEAKAKFDQGTALFVDSRSQEEFERSHIPNAISLPLSELNTQNPDLPRDAEIITYCT